MNIGKLSWKAALSEEVKAFLDKYAKQTINAGSFEQMMKDFEKLTTKQKNELIMYRLMSAR